MANKRVIVGTVKPDTYLITKDIALTLEGRYGLKLSDQQTREIRTLEDEFLAEFWPLVPKESKTVDVNAEDLQRRLSALISVEQLPVITLDDVYIKRENPYVAGALSVTRLTDPQTKQIIGLGPRPGNPSLEEQISALKEYKSICLVDIGAFEGGTLLEVINLLRNSRINVERAYLGVWGKQAVDAVNGAVDAYVFKTFNFYEWIELRDFFGIDGRKTPDGKFISFGENPKEWASIGEENAAAVSELCQRYYEKLKQLVQDEQRSLDTDLQRIKPSFELPEFQCNNLWKYLQDRRSELDKVMKQFAKNEESWKGKIAGSDRGML